MNFADTNWLEALYFDAKNKEQQARCATAARFMRQHGGLLGISHVVYLEARNVFSRNTGESEPEEWRLLLSDLNGRLYLDAMNWDVLRREAFALFARYSARATIGTLDMAFSHQPSYREPLGCFPSMKRLELWLRLRESRSSQP